MPGSGPRRSGRNRAAQEEEVEDAASVDSFHSDVSEAAAGRGQEEEGGEAAGGGQPATGQSAAAGDLVARLLAKLAAGETVSEAELRLADLGVKNGSERGVSLCPLGSRRDLGLGVV